MKLIQALPTRILFSLLWLFFTISLATWWLVIGLQITAEVTRLRTAVKGTNNGESLDKYQRMFKMEGAFFLVLLAGGGVTLIWLSYRDKKRSLILKDFFLTVSHEMKTPLANIRLQAESLEDYVEGAEGQKMMERLIKESSRLELQMDKALYLASINREENLYLEHIAINSLLQHLTFYDSDIEVTGNTEIWLYADRRAIESIFKNLIENAKIHSKAKRVFIEIYETAKNMAKIRISDNGEGFTGNTNILGKAFLRQSSSSGSGIGLFLVKTLMVKMNGEAKFFNNGKQLEVELMLPLGRKI
ncbi:MAG: HAMP domain-containing sensor histidine kinase [Spirochaetota bacterium]